MNFTPQTGHVSRNRGQGFVVESGRTRKQVGNGSSSYAAAVQTKHEYRSRGTANVRTAAKGQTTKARPQKPAISNPARNSPMFDNSLIDRMMQDGVHLHKIPVHVKLKRGQRLV